MTKPSSGGGFSIIPNWVLRESDLTAHELLVYIALLNHADRYGQAYPAMETLIREARVSEKSVRRALKSLEGRGVVQVTRRPREGDRHETNLYHVAVFDRTSPANLAGVGGKSATHWVAEQYPERVLDLPEEVDPQEEDPLEEDLRLTLPSEREPGFDFPSSLASKNQVAYLRDLFIHFYNDVPTEEDLEKWRTLTPEQATELIEKALKAIPRYSDYEGPEYGEPAYEELSAKGQEFADQGMVPWSPQGGG